MKKPDLTKSEIDEVVKAYFRGETCADIAKRLGRSNGLINAKLVSRGAYRFQPGPRGAK